MTKNYRLVDMTAWFAIGDLWEPHLSVSGDTVGFKNKVTGAVARPIVGFEIDKGHDIYEDVTGAGALATLDLPLIDYGDHYFEEETR